MAPHQPTSRDVLLVKQENLQLDRNGKWEYRFLHRDLPTRAVQTTPRLDRLTHTIALDGEFQLAYIEAKGKHIHRIGRISIVNDSGEVIYDVFVYYPQEEGVIIKLPPENKQLGVYREDIKPWNGALPIADVEQIVRDIIKDCIVVGHAISNDIKVFSPWVFDGVKIRDTQMLAEYRQHATGSRRLPKLSVLAEVVLGWNIQAKDHSSVEDAEATMALYLHRKDAIEAAQSGSICVAGLKDGEGEGDVVEWDCANLAFNLEELEEQKVDDEYQDMVLPPIRETEVAEGLQATASFWQAKSGALKETLAACKPPATPKQASKAPITGSKITTLSPTSASSSMAIKRINSDTTIGSPTSSASNTSMMSSATSDSSSPSPAKHNSPSPPVRFLSRSEAVALAKVKIAYPLRPPPPATGQQATLSLVSSTHAEIKHIAQSFAPITSTQASSALWSSFLAKGN